jgi:hypothetical protein
MALAVVAIPADLKRGSRSVKGLFVAADSDLSKRELFLFLVSNGLEDDPTLVTEWQTYSYDKRTSSGHYLDGRETGFFEHERHEVVRHERMIDARAAFMFSEARSVLSRAQIR